MRLTCNCETVIFLNNIFDIFARFDRFYQLQVSLFEHQTWKKVYSSYPSPGFQITEKFHSTKGIKILSNDNPDQ